MHKLIIGFSLLLVSINVQAQRKDVLVIVNDNSIDSIQLGSYYAKKRKINDEQVVHVKVPNQYYITWTEFKSLRDQILRFGICPSVEDDKRPAACSDPSIPIYTEENISALISQTNIRYIVMTRGLPTRMTVDKEATPYSSESTSIDNFLRFWLARYLVQDTHFFNFQERAIAFGDGHGMRTIIPAKDKEYILGRIDGLDLASARALIDRALYTEANGWYGKLYGSTFGYFSGKTISWTNYDTRKPIYGNDTNGWRYALGLMNEDRQECSDYESTSHYFAFSQSNTNGKAPAHCNAQFNKGFPNETIQGHPSSRSPIASDALAYFGSLDGHTVAGGFNTLLNWRKNDSCTVTLCENADDPAACRLASTDPHREINTECVGVAPGFIGYNYQSFPVSIFATWPTGWAPYRVDQNDPPTILDDNAAAGNASVWFTQLDEKASTSCYVYNNGNFDGSELPCPGNRKLGLTQTLFIKSTDPANPATYHLSYQLKGQKLQIPSSVTGYMQFIYPKVAGTDCPIGLNGSNSSTSCTFTKATNTLLPAGDSDWIAVQQTVTPPNNVDINFTSIIIGFHGTISGGGAGIDKVSFQETGNTTELAINGSFENGYKQTGNGDYAANFLSRLGGTAFWGSLSHHQSGGSSFSHTSLTTLVYLMRGLPLGDAVWLGEPSVSGIFYGDPLYSPVAVHLKLKNSSPWDFVIGKVKLKGSALNGNDDDLVRTSYKIDYCSGDDFYLCGTPANPWLSARPDGEDEAEDQEGKRNTDLGEWDARNLEAGNYILRLAVTSSNKRNAKSQTFNDYLPVVLYNQTSDADGDGLSDQLELKTYGTDPTLKDTDGDFLSDGDEVNVYHTDPLNKDTDGDGYTDGDEVARGGDPNDPLVIPLSFTSTIMDFVEVDVTNYYQAQVNRSDVNYVLYFARPGMQIDSTTGLWSWKPDYSFVGQTVAVAIAAQKGEIYATQYKRVAVIAINNGDINEDNVIDNADVILAQQIVAGSMIPTERQRARADVVHDLVIDNADIEKIKASVSGL